MKGSLFFYVSGENSGGFLIIKNLITKTWQLILPKKDMTRK